MENILTKVLKLVCKWEIRKSLTTLMSNFRGFQTETSQRNGVPFKQKNTPPAEYEHWPWKSFKGDEWEERTVLCVGYCQVSGSDYLWFMNSTRLTMYFGWKKPTSLIAEACKTVARCSRTRLSRCPPSLDASTNVLISECHWIAGQFKFFHLKRLFHFPPTLTILKLICWNWVIFFAMGLLDFKKPLHYCCL